MIEREDSFSLLFVFRVLGNSEIPVASDRSKDGRIVRRDLRYWMQMGQRERCERESAV